MNLPAPNPRPSQQPDGHYPWEKPGLRKRIDDARAEAAKRPPPQPYYERHTQ